MLVAALVTLCTGEAAFARPALQTPPALEALSSPPSLPSPPLPASSLSTQRPAADADRIVPTIVLQSPATRRLLWICAAGSAALAAAAMVNLRRWPQRGNRASS